MQVPLQQQVSSIAAPPDWYPPRLTEVEAAIAAHLKVVKSALGSHSRLADAVEYSMRSGGKRLRPILVLEACATAGGPAADAMPAAIAVECVHAFTLIHDDLPAMDDDDLRRGRPTSHRVFGEALAILAGDWLQAHAFALLVEQARTPAMAAAWMAELAAATADVIAGQAADVESEGREPDAALVEIIHGWKTARLIQACCRMGAAAARASAAASDALGEYGQRLGLAFQIVDDLLDATGVEESVGKRVGKDATVAKQTYPAAFGVAESRRQVEREIAAALGALDPFGASAERLRDIAGFVAARDR